MALVHDLDLDIRARSMAQRRHHDAFERVGDARATSVVAAKAHANHTIGDLHELQAAAIRLE